MQLKQLIHLNTPVYKVVSHATSLYLLCANQFIEINIPGGHKVTHTINELSAILDLTFHDNLIYLAGIGHPPLIYSPSEMRTIQTLGNKQATTTAYSAITQKNGTLYCANIHAETLEIWKENALLHSFHIGTFVKQLHWMHNTLFIAVAESEDSGYLLLYQLDEQNELHPQDVYLDCHFPISTVSLSTDQTELLITGGFPPLNIQIHSYPDLRFKKEMMLAADYEKEQFGNDTGFTFNLCHQPVNSNELIFPYTDGSILLINHQTNKYRSLLETGETWIYTQFIENNLVGVTAEGNICLIEEHNFMKPTIKNNLIPAPFHLTNKPITTRYTITANDIPEDLTLQTGI